MKIHQVSNDQNPYIYIYIIPCYTWFVGDHYDSMAHDENSHFSVLLWGCFQRLLKSLWPKLPCGAVATLVIAAWACKWPPARPHFGDVGGSDVQFHGGFPYYHLHEWMLPS